MFSGIVQGIGEVRDVRPGQDQRGKRMQIFAPIAPTRLELGASVAHAGACMTLASPPRATANGSLYDIDVSPESLAKTTLDSWAAGRPINIETSLRLGETNGGHNVSGHVDGTATLIARERQGENWTIRVSVAPDLLRFLPPKGSVALDGISLTIVDPRLEPAGTASFDVAVVPHTWAHTTLADTPVGAAMNLEIDALARYVAGYIDHFMTSGTAMASDTRQRT